MKHISVLLNEVIKILDPKPGEFFVDGTLGEGGHATVILDRIMPNGRLLGIDWDEEAIKNFELKIQNLKLPEASRQGGSNGAGKTEGEIILINDNFMNLAQILKNKKLGKADGVLLDLGFSSGQLNGGRGFSFLKDEPLLMTYKQDAAPLKAVLKNLSEEALFTIIKEYSEERYARRIAKAIFQKERKKPIETSGELAEVVAAAVPRHYERGRIHPATRTFLAFRIYINNELENLKFFLESLEDILAPGGRVGIISFNSQEDRIVKNLFRQMAKKNILKILTKKPIAPSIEEIRQNPRARSAKFRACSKF